MRQRLIRWTGVLVVVLGVLQPLCLSQSSCYTGEIVDGLGRALQFKWERTEQPNLVLVQGPGNTTQIVPNPERHLNNHSFIFDFSQVYPSIADADLKDGCKNKKTWRQRALGGVSLSVSLSENPRVVQSTILPASRGVGYKIAFDASKVFKADDKTDAKPDANKLWALLPTFSFERKTPFDFLKYSGQLVPATTESGRNALSFTWDFRGVMSPRKASKSTPTAQIEKLCVIRGTATSYVSVPADASVAMCQELATGLGAQEFQLACASEKTVTKGDRISSKSLLGDLRIEDIQPDGNACKWNERPQVARLEQKISQYFATVGVAPRSRAAERGTHVRKTC